MRSEEERAELAGCLITGAAVGAGSLGVAGLLSEAGALGIGRAVAGMAAGGLLGLAAGICGWILLCVRRGTGEGG